VLVIEDHEPFREFVSSILQNSPGFRVISQVANGAEAVQIAENLRPDLILLDIGLPGLNGIEVARRILQLCPDSKILFVSQESSVDIVTEALSTGAMGYLVKADAGSELPVAVNSVLLGKKFMSRTVRRIELRPTHHDLLNKSI
jgi:DNA-binding NarL/FixJ family response regulator